jgi:SAM-dependent methyltransferase
VSRALAERGAAVWGIDPSTEMLAQARAQGGAVQLASGSAESLPFPDASFDRAVLRLVVHLVDRPRAFHELSRVLAPGGQAVIATFRPDHVERIWLNPYFPSLRAIDLERFPDPDLLVRELGEAGFEGVTWRPLSQRRHVARGEALERIRGRFISTLRLLPESEFRTGLERAERELPEAIDVELHWAILVALAPAV